MGRATFSVVRGAAKDEHVAERASILKFIENNWDTGRIGDTFFDRRAGSLNNMFRFARGHRHSKRIILNRNGAVS